MSTHTRGPWKSACGVAKTVAEAQANHNCILAGYYSDVEIAEIYETEIDGEQHANARLIAASPEMCDQLEYAITFLEGYTESESPGAKRLVKTIGAVLAKVKPKLYGNYLKSAKAKGGAE